MSMRAADALTFPIQLVECVESLVRVRQGDIRKIYTYCNIDPDALQQAEERLSVLQFEKLMQLALEHLLPGEPRSIQMLRHLPVTAHGMVGMAAITAENLSTALDAGLRYFPLILPAFELSRENTGHMAQVHIRRLHDFGCPCNELLTEMIAGGFAKMAYFASSSRMAQHHAKSSQNMEVYLTHQSTEDPAAFLAFYGLPVQFGSLENTFLISRKVLQQPLLTHNRTTHQALITALDQQLHSRAVEKPVTRRARLLLTQSLSRANLLGATDIASDMNLSVRTLSRRLAEEGASLVTLIEEVRIERAQMLLISSDLPIARIAQQLGYSNTSTFSRAFKRVKDRVPSDLRRPANSANDA